MASYMHIGNENNIAQKVKSILLIGGGGNTYTARNIYYGNSEGRAEPSYRRVNTSTWYTSSTDPGDMYETTALTDVSTTGTSYETIETTVQKSARWSTIQNYTNLRSYRAETLWYSQIMTVISGIDIPSNYIYTCNYSTINGYSVIENGSSKWYSCSRYIVIGTSFYSYSIQTLYMTSSSITSQTKVTKTSSTSYTRSVGLYTTTWNNRIIIDKYTTTHSSGGTKSAQYDGNYSGTTTFGELVTFNNNNEFNFTTCETNYMTNPAYYSQYSYSTYRTIMNGVTLNNSTIVSTTNTIYYTNEVTTAYSGKSSSTYIPD